MDSGEKPIGLCQNMKEGGIIQCLSMRYHVLALAKGNWTCCFSSNSVVCSSDCLHWCFKLLSTAFAIHEKLWRFGKYHGQVAGRKDNGTNELLLLSLNWG
ncbi:uncharacterized protein LOC113342031 isoform X4 [Papaver somniferum]|uniref:uncharacterized protein LOC113342031 isoform X4 n=1 Tax=Papaver somniferum TaxID=3469 RepID=UPI000E7001FB|nr:uncharacterized protein LOC113342031 isoform X4 [Papaver somniferum]